MAVANSNSDNLSSRDRTRSGPAADTGGSSGPGSGYPSSWPWGSITDTPTTLAGYGITDAVLSSDLADVALTGNALDVDFASSSGLSSTDVASALDELHGLVGSGDASSVSYDNSVSGLSATDVQDALDELAASAGSGGDIVATGGTITTDGTYKYHTFTADGSFVVTTGGDVDYMLVGGGAGGGGFGGGGGGRFRKFLAQTLAPGSYAVDIGAGGAGAAAGNQRGTNGADTTFNGDTAEGGGGGGAFDDTVPTGANGGSGGGGGTDGTAPYTGRAGGTAVGSGGNDGGDGVTGATAGGGGGGAGTPGDDGAGNVGGDGGDGVLDSFTGAPVRYAPGGAGAGLNTGGAGGTGGGGGGGSYNGGAGPGPVAATGIGAGGGAAYAGLFAVSLAGTAGRVIIRYLLSGLSLSTAGNLLIGTSDESHLGEDGIGFGNSSNPPSANPVLGGFLFVDAGALKYRGSGGTVTTIAPA